MLKNFYDTLGESDKRKFVKEVLAVTDWSLPTFYYKLKNDNLSKLEQAALQKLIKKWHTSDEE